MLTAKEKRERLEMVVALLQDADAMLQGTLGASDECYELHNAIENIAEEIAELGEALLEAE
jgi:hypothetical protein